MDQVSHRYSPYCTLLVCNITKPTLCEKIVKGRSLFLLVIIATDMILLSRVVVQMIVKL